MLMFIQHPNSGPIVCGMRTKGQVHDANQVDRVRWVALRGRALVADTGASVAYLDADMAVLTSCSVASAAAISSQDGARQRWSWPSKLPLATQ